MIQRWGTAVVATAGLWLFGACAGDDGSAGATDGETETGSTGAQDTGGPMTTQAADSTTGDDGVDGTSTGGPTLDGLQPCDPRDDEPCATGVCAGAGHSGYYCRPPCSAMAVSGDSCGADDVCLSDGHSEQLACFDIQDCDFLSGSPCGAGEKCAVLTFEPLRTACVPGTEDNEGPCGPAGALTCPDGSGCLGTDLDGDDAGSCQGWCAPGEPLPQGCGECIPLTDALGSCAQCSVLDQDCPDGQACQPVNELLGGVCLDHGPAGPGEPCVSFGEGDTCQEGHLCLETEIDDTFSCVPTCDPTDPVCQDPEASCADLGLIVEGAQSGQLGLCLVGGSAVCEPDADPRGCQMDQVCFDFGEGTGLCSDACDPTDGGISCDMNFACLPTDDGGTFNVEPFVEGNGACGNACSDDTDCGGETCLRLDGVETDGICGTTCTPPAGAECAGGQTCVATPGDPTVGACVVGGTSCDETAVGGCPGPAACVELEGGADSVCMPPCFEQDPNACGGMPDNCHVKTASRWHGGACLGSPEACDPIVQDCDDGFSCGVLGGQAIGGVAFACDEDGVVPEGGDCADADCGEGLACVDDVCRMFCDPAADDCAVGTCNDLSALLYLPVDSLGACM